MELVRQYDTQKAFLDACGISNHSYISDIKTGKNQNPTAFFLSQIVRGTGCSGTWLLTGEGEMFESRINQSSGREIPYRVLMDRAEELLSSIEEKVNQLDNDELSPDIDVQLSQVLTAILQRRAATRK